MTTGMNEEVTARWFFRRSLRERQVHADKVQTSTLSLPAYTELAPPMHAFLF